MNRAFQLFLLLIFVSSYGCGGARLSQNEIRKQIAELGSSTLNPKAVSVRRIVSQSGNHAIAETTVDLAVQFERDTASSPWHISAIRLGDQNWVPVPQFLAALQEVARKTTSTSLDKLVAGVATYRQRTGNLPAAKDIRTLADVLHPLYMNDLVLDDGWGRPIELEASDSGIRFRSLGADGKRGTVDDILTAP